MKPLADQGKFTCISLNSNQFEMLYAGHSNGQVSVIDCAQAKIVSHFAIGST